MLKDKTTEYSEITLQNVQRQNYRMLRNNSTERSKKKSLNYLPSKTTIYPVSI